MSSKKIINKEEHTWEQVIVDLKKAPVPFQYKATFRHNDIPVSLMIDIDPGGGFEGGLEFTSLSAPVPIHVTSLKASVPKQDDFRFALHDQGLLDRVGKFFGMEDVVVGYPEFDKQLIIKTNDAARVKKIFSAVGVRRVFQSLQDFTLHIEHDDDKNNVATLELMIDKALTDAKELRKVYDAFVQVLDALTEK